MPCSAWGGGLPSTARLGYPIFACTATSEKFSRQVAVKFSLDSFCARAARARANSHARREFHGPQIANVRPGFWTFTNSVLPSGEKHAPANSRFLGCGLCAMRWQRPCGVTPTTWFSRCARLPSQTTRSPLGAPQSCARVELGAACVRVRSPGTKWRVDLRSGILVAHPVDLARLIELDRRPRLPVLRQESRPAHDEQRLEEAAASVIAHA